MDIIQFAKHYSYLRGKFALLFYLVFVYTYCVAIKISCGTEVNFLV